MQAKAERVFVENHLHGAVDVIGTHTREFLSEQMNLFLPQTFAITMSVSYSWITVVVPSAMVTCHTQYVMFPPS